MDFFFFSLLFFSALYTLIWMMQVSCVCFLQELLRHKLLKIQHKSVKYESNSIHWLFYLAFPQAWPHLTEFLALHTQMSRNPNINPNRALSLICGCKIGHFSQVFSPRRCIKKQMDAKQSLPFIQTLTSISHFIHRLLYLHSALCCLTARFVSRAQIRKKYYGPGSIFLPVFELHKKKNLTLR